MRLDTLILADSANEAGGKLNILGAGITRLTPPVLPWSQVVTLIVRAILEPDDFELDHTVRVLLLDPHDSPLLPPFDMTFGPDDLRPIRERTVEGETTTAQLLFVMQGARINEAGTHQFVVEFDGHEVGRMPLPVVLSQG
jgi:hypothetical protein